MLTALTIARSTPTVSDLVRTLCVRRPPASMPAPGAACLSAFAAPAALPLRRVCRLAHLSPARPPPRLWIAPPPRACALPTGTPPSPPRRTRLSLPTRHERRLLYESGVFRGRILAQARGCAFTLRVSSLDRQSRPCRPASAAESPPPIPEWAYVAHVRAAKTSLGKRAVVRNRAKRRVRAAAAAVLPVHALRGREYAFTVTPEALVAPFGEMVRDVEAALRSVGCFVEEVAFRERRRCRSRSSVVVVGERAADGVQEGDELPEPTRLPPEGSPT